MSRVPQMATEPYKMLAWRIIEDATRQAKRGNVEDITWLLTEGKDWLNELGVDGQVYVNRVVNEAQKRTDFDLLTLLIQTGDLSWQAMI